MIHTLLLRFNNPKLYAVVKALKELRGLIHYCVTDEIPGRNRISKAKSRVSDIHQKARDKYPRSRYTRLIYDIQQLLALFEGAFLEIRDYNLERTPEMIRFFAVYLSILDTLSEAVTGSFLKSCKTAALAGMLIADGRKLLRSFRADCLSRPDNLSGGMTLLTLYGRFETGLSEADKLSKNIVSAKYKKNRFLNISAYSRSK